MTYKTCLAEFIEKWTDVTYAMLLTRGTCKNNLDVVDRVLDPYKARRKKEAGQLASK